MKVSSKIKFNSFVLWFLMMIGFASAAFAENPPAVPAGSNAPSAPAQAPPPSGIMGFAPFILIFAIFYFMLIRPQQKKAKEQMDMLSALKQGDEVITAAGILGKVTGINDKVVTVEVADDVRVKMLKTQISQVVKGSLKDALQQHP
jgi:preprotein translocase subunit YajC